MTCLVILHNDS